MEEVLKVREKHLKEDPSRTNRDGLLKAQAELSIQLRREEELWRQNAGFEWFKDEERNTKFFCTIVKGGRARLKVTRIQKTEGIQMEDQAEIVEAAIDFFQKQFIKQEDEMNFSMLDVLSSVISQEQNKN